MSVELELDLVQLDSAVPALDVRLPTTNPHFCDTDKHQTVELIPTTATPPVASTSTVPAALRTLLPLVPTPRLLPVPRSDPFLTVALVSTTVSPPEQLL